MIKILVVDDEKGVCDFVGGFFKKFGHPVLKVTDPFEAAAVVEKERPQIILLDLKMPKMDGFEVLKQIRQIDKQAKVIMVTVSDDAQTRQKAQELGADAFVKKPFSTDYLRDTVMSKIQELYPLKTKEAQ